MIALALAFNLAAGTAWNRSHHSELVLRKERIAAHKKEILEKLDEISTAVYLGQYELFIPHDCSDIEKIADLKKLGYTTQKWRESSRHCGDSRYRDCYTLDQEGCKISWKDAGPYVYPVIFDDCGFGATPSSCKLIKSAKKKAAK